MERSDILITINDVLDKVRENNIGGEEVIRRAYLLASKLHEGQFRQSGEPYITHPLYVAYILASTYNDTETIVAGLLHDTIEDTDITLEEIANQFGNSVAVPVIKALAKEIRRQLLDRIKE